MNNDSDHSSNSNRHAGSTIRNGSQHGRSSRNGYKNGGFDFADGPWWQLSTWTSPKNLPILLRRIRWTLLFLAVCEMLHVNHRVSMILMQKTDWGLLGVLPDGTSHDKAAAAVLAIAAKSQMGDAVPWKVPMSGRHMKETSLQGAPIDLDSTSARLYLFEVPQVLMYRYGAHLTAAEEFLEQSITQQLKAAMCHKIPEDQQAWCGYDLEVLKCVSCSPEEGSWYHGISHVGALAGRVNEYGKLQIVDTTHHSQREWKIDLIVPASGQDTLLRDFATRVGVCLKELQKELNNFKVKLNVRMFTSRYPVDAMESVEAVDDFRRELAELADLTDEHHVQFVKVASKRFNSAQAINALLRRACHDPSCIVAVMDADMDLTPLFLRNAFAFVEPGVTAYFPVMWSQFNPETSDMSQRLFNTYNNLYLWPFDPHMGYWAETSFNICALAGSDAGRMVLNEDVNAWEETGRTMDSKHLPFQQQVSQELHLVRMPERGLTHVWHAKNCNTDDPRRMRPCVGSTADMEGEAVGLLLRHLRESDPEEYEDLMYPKQIMIIVMTDRTNFLEHTATIKSTWGSDESLLIGGITIWYVLGDGRDVTDLLEQSGVVKDHLIVLPGLFDEENPPIHKTAAMLKAVPAHIEAIHQRTDWVFKVEPDTYVNLAALKSFVAELDPAEHNYMGQRGFDRLGGQEREELSDAGLSKPFCMSGPGYLLSLNTLNETAKGIDECVTEAAMSPHKDVLWSPDIIVGMCIQKNLGIGCWDRPDGSDRHAQVFAHSLQGVETLVKNLEVTVSLHPLKTADEMQQLHLRFVEE